MTDDFQQQSQPQEENSEDRQPIPETSEPSPSEPESVDYKDKWLRATADYQNLQKEVAQQRTLWARMSKVDVLVEFIPVYENFKKAFQVTTGSNNDSAHAQCENWKKGIGFIMKQFEDILHRHNIEPIKTVGEKFDPTRHEAISEEVTEDHEEGVILREVEGGYMVDGQVLRPAKVIMSKKV